jgi:formylglycine-generating enzyme required for sulfatase activity
MKCKQVIVAIIGAVLCFKGVTIAVCPTADLTGDCKVNMGDFAVLAGQWLNGSDIPELEEMAGQWLSVGMPEPALTWVTIAETGFTGQMSKYETTNAQYCLFLNAALATGDVIVSSNLVKGANGTNNGMDFVGSDYYNTTGTGYGADARISYSGGVFTVAAGYENYPVNYVSCSGAKAFCGYYGWLLPTLAQWQAVADYNGTYTYGCGTTIDTTRANYNYYVGTTSAVGSYTAFGYGMCDMAGNVFEWTNTNYLNNAFCMGGGLNSAAANCKISKLLEIDRAAMAFSVGFRVCRVAGGIPEPEMTWTSVADYAFVGQISKYETTNAQYCQFLNDALSSGDIVVSGSVVNGAAGTNSGVDYAGLIYYDLAGAGGNADGVVNGGAARIIYSDGVFTVATGFEDHPVTYVSRPGAEAFCGYYGWRLPDRYQWQAVADNSGTDVYTYGCGRYIHNSIANYLGSVHPAGTTVAGAFGTYGYGVCDMAGNVFEWTSSGNADDYMYQGGSWDSAAALCKVQTFPMINQFTTTYNLGFRACR